MVHASGMDTTEGQQILDRFRRAVYRDVLGRRKDSAFELMEAALISSGPRTLVRLSLEPVFRRGWPSACDGLADGTLDADALRERLAAALVPPPAGARPVWAADGTTWPRPAAATVAERTFAHMVTPGIPQSGVVPGWEYQWMFAIPEAAGSWALPLDERRRGPAAGSPTELLLAQLADVLPHLPADYPRPVLTADSSYDAVVLAARVQDPDPEKRLAIDILVRLSPRRCFYRPPPPYPGRGAPAKHGPVLKLWDPETHPAPDRRAVGHDPRHGEVRVDVWVGLHARKAADVPLTLVRVRVEHLPRSARSPKPLWLAFAGELPADLLDLWRWYARRYTCEHAFRFLKHDLGWTTARPGDPEAADRWSGLLALALWQLWLARALVTDRRLPWERPADPERLSPGRVRRAFAGLLPALGSPARPARARGKSPGRHPGSCPGPRERHPVFRRARKKAKPKAKAAA